MSAAFPRPRRITLLLALALMVLGAIVLLAHRADPLGPPPASAQGATIVVNTLADPTALVPEFACPLRVAIRHANQNTQLHPGCAAGSDGGEDRITFAPELGGAILLTDHLPAITDPAGLIIDGDDRITISGDDEYRVFFVATGAALTLENVAVSEGRGVLGFGGGVSVNGSFTANNSFIENNTVGLLGGGGIYITETGAVELNNTTVRNNEVAVDGGGIYNNGTITVVESLIANNRTDENGGGIYNSSSGQLTITNSIIGSQGSLQGNTAGCVGGGIYNDDGGEVTLVGSAISDNSAPNCAAGGVFNRGDLTVTNSAISNNSALFRGGIDNADGTVALTGSIINGNTAAAGGGIGNSSAGEVAINRSEVSGNRATLFHGGGIINAGTLRLTHSTVGGNVAGSDGGGGIWNSSAGTLTLTNSTVSGNEAKGIGNGGGIRNSATVTLANSTVSGNTTENNGGGIWNNSAGTLTLTNSTVTANHANGQGGGIYNDDGDVTLLNTIVAGHPFSDDCAGAAPASGGHNLDGDGTCALATHPADISKGDANLGPLADNGGRTLTHALLEGSDAIDAGSNPVCAADPVNNVDQRRAPRPHGKACDIGAFEFGAEPPPVPLWGDADCDGNVAIGDALKTARHLLGLSVTQTQPCPEIGAEASAHGAPRTWGDVDCDETVAIGDALKIARWLLGLSVSQEEGCPEIGTPVALDS